MTKNYTEQKKEMRKLYKKQRIAEEIYDFLMANSQDFDVNQVEAQEIDYTTGSIVFKYKGEWITMEIKNTESKVAKELDKRLT